MLQEAVMDAVPQGHSEQKEGSHSVLNMQKLPRTHDRHMHSTQGISVPSSFSVFAHTC